MLGTWLDFVSPQRERPRLATETRMTARVLNDREHVPCLNPQLITVNPWLAPIILRVRYDVQSKSGG